MPIMLYPKCWRNRQDCEPIHCIDGVDKDLTEEQMMTLDYEPSSFVCSGHVIGERKVRQDAYRLCFKNHCSDEMSDNDIQDLSSVIAVAAAAINLDAVRKVNRGAIELPAEQAK
ncbi:hypothetical protein QQ73_02770 [Candidatus Endoriftia persephone str. Guaymas]|nr:hypothetical protein [Candidatus Endoriftia persephone str. Guaymas]